MTQVSLFTPRHIHPSHSHRIASRLLSLTDPSRREAMDGKDAMDEKDAVEDAAPPLPQRHPGPPLLLSPLLDFFFSCLAPVHSRSKPNKKIINLVFAAYAIMVEEDSVVHFYNCAINRFTLLEGCRG